MHACRRAKHIIHTSKSYLQPSYVHCNLRGAAAQPCPERALIEAWLLLVLVLGDYIMCVVLQRSLLWGITA